MTRRVLGILAMLMACAALAVVAAHASPLSGPIGGGPSGSSGVGSGLVGTSQSAPAAVAGCTQTQSATSATQPQDAAEPGETELVGCVASVDQGQSIFTLSTATGTVTVLVNPQTEYSDGLSSLGSLQTGMSISVDAATQSDGTAVATSLSGPNEATDAPDSSDANSGDTGD